MAKISFARAQHNFSGTLRKRVEEYFSTSSVKNTGNWKLYTKTIVLFLSLILLYTTLVFLHLPAWAAIPLCIVMGMNIAAIGFNVMHDGCHGSYSTKPWVNDLMGYSLDILGGCSYLWKVKHNVAHHSYTNIEGHDDDIDNKPLMRMSTNQKKYWFHKYQHIYWPVLYCFTYFMWIAIRDFNKYFSRKIAETEVPPMTLNQHFLFWLGKVIYTCLFIVIPVWQLGWVNFAIGYGVLSAAVGLTIAIVFQLAHVVDKVEFPVPAEDTGKIEQEYYLHQLATTANFSTRSKFLGWFTGGLNFQVEHHLFPRISHIHYPAISRIVKQVCAEYGVAYHEFPTFFSAVRAHVLHLKRVGAA
ncbi:MAG: acyl-CoA desaturase [Bacteroidetes bacterium]|nr:acyl-CoA desaturase [Bacteroidota bacterium]